METRDFVSRYPRLWHLAHGDAWPGIRRHGLLTAAQLVTLLDGPERPAGESRAEQVELTHPERGSAVLRDQQPLDVARLATVLEDGLSVDDWLGLLDRMVWFFPSEEAMAPLHGKYSAEPATVLVVDTASLVRQYELFVKLATINSGATVRRPVARGRDTFLSLRRFDYPRKKPKEIAVEGGVPTIMDHLVSAELWTPDGGRTALE